MTTLYFARWVLPITSPAMTAGAIAVDGSRILSVGSQTELAGRFPDAKLRNYGNAAIIPGLINGHTHLELTGMRGFLEAEELNFFGWLRKLTLARGERMTADDLRVSAAWGACEALRSGVTCVADASNSASESMHALREVGLRGIVFQESFGPDARLASKNLQELEGKVSALRELESPLVKCGVSPHAPYTVSARQLEMISRFATDQNLPLMMHAAETGMEVSLLRDGSGPFAAGLRDRGIEWTPPGVSPIQYLNQHGVLDTRPLLAHCIQVNDDDLDTLGETQSKVAHCPISNAKLGHGVAPFARMIEKGLTVALGSDSVASNNTCDLLAEARFALLLARAQSNGQTQRTFLSSIDVLQAATVEGANAMGLEGQIGELSAGMAADFAVVSLDGVHQIPMSEPETALIFSSSARDVIATVVAGREVFSEGRIATVDEDRLRQRIQEIAVKLRVSNP